MISPSPIFVFIYNIKIDDVDESFNDREKRKRFEMGGERRESGGGTPTNTQNINIVPS